MFLFNYRINNKYVIHNVDGKERKGNEGKGREESEGGKSQIYTNENKLLTVIAINRMYTKTKFDNKHRNHTNIHAYSHKNTHTHTHPQNKFQNSSAQFEKNIIFLSNE